MLVLSRKESDAVIIGKTTSIKVLSINGNRVKLGIDAPDDVTIRRAEKVITMENEE